MQFWFESILINQVYKHILKGHSSTYRIEEIIGEGVYGKVFKCKKLETRETVAIKVVRKDINNSGRREISNMKLLRQHNLQRYNLIKLTDHFVHMRQDCLAFEMLDKDLFEYMNDRQFQSMRVSEIRLIAQQMLVALEALKSIGMVHADIKPDNIMLVNHKSSPFRVKLIDFGMAEQVSRLETGSLIQPCSFRAFEVTLGLPLNEAVDMWSLGCTLAFLYTGELLFPWESDYGNIREEKQEDSYSLIQSYADLERMPPVRKSPDERKDIRAFISLLKEMLALDPDKRISPSEALKHDFITMKHLAGSSSGYVKKAKKMMKKIQLPTSSEKTPSRPVFTRRYAKPKLFKNTTTTPSASENAPKVTPQKLPVITEAGKSTTERVSYEFPVTRNIIYVKPYRKPSLSLDSRWGTCDGLKNDSAETKTSVYSSYSDDNEMASPNISITTNVKQAKNNFL
uniref:Protein kinase domain-containing protein n=1 Tax=Fundulus heteroclitus TaxID=8078 RepID=A0A3Q2R0K3_FUNHE